ncbi:hypothetical protein DL96DRAFT_1819808 [Flagelloscypha sp. PMI_526]|nr:hypothetical protein DL96DRAFT_1819808 [Flagelloscypha sp. PMI_526]
MSSQENSPTTLNPEIHFKASDVDTSNDMNPSPPVAPDNVQDGDGVYQRKQHSHKVFGLPPYQPGGSGIRNFDYDSKYPNEDPPGEEASENARVWRIYNDEAELFDDDMLHGFRDTLDSLLVFAALFSAVVTTFLVQTSTTLKPDYGQITTNLLAEQIQLLRANGNVTTINSLPSSLLSPNSDTWSSTDVAVNALFVVSLALSLSAALFSILVKQWLIAYAAKIPGTAKDVALIRHFRFYGLQKWKLPQMIGILPLVIHSSLWVFSAGLLLFVWQLNLTVFCAAASILGTTFGLYTISLVVPPFITDCPYQIPFLDTPIRFFGRNSWDFLIYLFEWARYHFFRTSRIVFPQTKFLRRFRSYPRFYLRFRRLRSQFEHTYSRRPGNLCEAIVWLCDYSSNPTIRLAAAKSLAGMLPIDENNRRYFHWVYDTRAARALAENELIINTIWEQLENTSLPSSLTELRSRINPSSPTYNPWIRAESALHSWSYCWVQQGKLSASPDWVAHRGSWAVLRSKPMKDYRKDFFTYIVECDDVWDPTTSKWATHQLDWHQGFAGMPSILRISIYGLYDLVEPISRKLDVNELLNTRYIAGWTPVGFAACNGHLKTVKALVAAGADLTRGESPLYLATYNDRLEVVEFLLGQPGVVEHTGMEATASNSPFYNPIMTGKLNMIRLLLEKGVRVSLKHRTELKEKAKQANRSEIFEILEQSWGSESSDE